MKINKNIWFDLLVLNRNYDTPSEDIFEIIKTSKISNFNYLENEVIHTDTMEDLSSELSQIDIDLNQNLKTCFFKNFNFLNNISKKIILKQDKDSSFKKYLLDNILFDSNIPDLHMFRKNIDKDTLQKGLQNFFEKTKFFNSKQNKEDYWDNHISGKDINKLLVLLELAQFKKEDLKNWNKIGIINNVNQAKLDELINKKQNVNLVSAKDKNVFLMEISIDTIAIIKTDKNLGIKTISNFEHCAQLIFQHALKNSPISIVNENTKKKYSYLFFEEKDFFNAVKKRDQIMTWLEENTINLIRMIKNKNNIIEIDNDMKDLANKIVVKSDLENILLKKESKTKPLKI